ncbi:MAG: hypothetical protein HY744_04725 [Deltaproteobacteria bacterium]|nr:hypothetical protein [Deltaproteobacteria bacterium]
MSAASRSIERTWAAVFAASMIAAGCGGEQAPVQAPAEPAAEAEPEAEPEEAADAGRRGDAAAPAPAAKPEIAAEPAGPSRPAVLMEDPDKLSSTFGTQAALLALKPSKQETAMLRLPEFGLRYSTNVTWEVAKQGKSTRLKLGRVYQLLVQNPSGSTRPVKRESGGPPFEIATGTFGKPTVNLAIGEIVAAEEGEGQLGAWRIIAPKRVEQIVDQNGRVTERIAHFELTELPSAFIHVTTAPPTEGDAQTR